MVRVFAGDLPWRSASSLSLRLLPNAAKSLKDDPTTAMGEKLVVLCVKLSQRVPQFILDEAVVPPWLNLSLATPYLSLAKHWLPFLPAPEVAKAVDRYIDDCFFDFVGQTTFDAKDSDVIMHSAERETCCRWADIGPDAFVKEFSDTRTVLNLAFPNRCNQYAADLRAGMVRELESKRNALGPIIFAYKRFNQHVYGIDCDERTIDFGIVGLTQGFGLRAGNMEIAIDMRGKHRKG